VILHPPHRTHVYVPVPPDSQANQEGGKITVNVCIVYDSRTGNTEQLALAVAEGAKSVKGAEVVLKKVDSAMLEDLLSADAIVLGSPTYYGDMSGRLKELIDKSNKIHGKIEGKVGGAFTSSGGTQCSPTISIVAGTSRLVLTYPPAQEHEIDILRQPDPHVRS
jgi:multimeric flavodoxin WrbA